MEHGLGEVAGAHRNVLRSCAWVPKDWISCMPEKLSCSLAFSSARAFWERRKHGCTLVEKTQPAAKMKGMGMQVSSPSCQLMVNSTASTPNTVKRLVQSSGIRWA